MIQTEDAPLASPHADGDSTAFGVFPPPNPAETARLLQQIAQDLGARYELHGYLGQGAFATVWQASDRVTGQTVAIKRFNPQLGVGSSFYRELSTLFRLSDPRIVQIINLMETAAGARYLILEFCAGGTLRLALQRAQISRKVCSAERVRSIGVQLAEGLAAAHRLGIVHRDLKPENVLFATADAGVFGGAAAVKLADFGLARALENTPPEEGQALRSLSGSPAYMAPEQFEGHFGAATDLYALGVILYELLHGRLPFEGSPERLAYQHLRDTPAINRALPRPWPALLGALLDKNFTRRLSSSELVEKLRMTPVDPSAPSHRKNNWSVRGAETSSAFALFTQSGSTSNDFLAVSPDGVYRFRAEGGKPSGGVPLPRIHRCFQAVDGSLWFLRAGDVFRLDPEGSLPLLLSGDSTIDAVAPWRSPDDSRVAVVCGDELSDWRLCDPPRGRIERIWRATIRTSGLRPTLFRLGDGRIVCAEGPISPRLTVFGTDGRVQASIPLPGLCWHLGGWAASSVVYAKLLRNNQFVASRIDVENGDVQLLPDSDGIVLMTHHPVQVGHIYGLRATGEIVGWQDRDEPATILTYSFNKATFRSFATDGRWFGVLGREAGGAWMHVRSVRAGPGDVSE